MNRHKGSWIALTGLSIANLVGCLDLTIVNTALPSIQTSMSLNKTQLQWIVNIIFFALTAFMVIAGKIADRYGRRLVLYIGMLLFAITSIGAGLSITFHMLLSFGSFKEYRLPFYIPLLLHSFQAYFLKKREEQWVYCLVLVDLASQLDQLLVEF